MTRAHRRLFAWLAAAALFANALVVPAAHALGMHDAFGGSDFCSAVKPPSHGGPGFPSQQTPGHHGSDCVCHGGGSGIVQAPLDLPLIVLAESADAVATSGEEREGAAPAWPVADPRPPPRFA